MLIQLLKCCSVLLCSIVHSTEGISVGLVEEEDGLYKYIGSAQHVAFISRTVSAY